MPGYRASQQTIGAASRLPLAFVGVLRDALANGDIAEGGAEPGPLRMDGQLAGQAAALSAALAQQGGPGVPGDLLVRAVIAWTQLFGMLSFELFGQFVGSFEPADAFFGYAAAQLAEFVGLRPCRIVSAEG